MGELRILRKDELPALLALYRHLHDDDLPADPVRLEQAWDAIMDNPRFVCFGAFQNGELVASCALAIVPNLTRGARAYGLIENVVTHPAYRRRGLGKAVLRAANAHAWAHGCYKVMLMTSRKDAGTLAFYRAAGFDADAKQAFVARPAG